MKPASNFNKDLHTSLSTSLIKIVVLLNVSLNYNFCLLLFVIISFLLLCWLFSVVHESHAGVLKMPRVSNSLKDYGVLEVI